MKYSLTFVFLFIGNSLITEYNPDVKTMCDWFAMSIYYVPNCGKNVGHYYKTIMQELVVVAVAVAVPGIIVSTVWLVS